MGKARTPPMENNKQAAKIALAVVMKNSTANKSDIVDQILEDLREAGHKYGITHVRKFLRFALEPKRDLVRPMINKARRKYRTQDAQFKVRQFRVEGPYKIYMDAPMLVSWNQQLEDAQRTAAAWNEKHANYDPVELQKIAGKQALGRYHARQREIKERQAAASVDPAAGIEPAPGVAAHVQQEAGENADGDDEAVPMQDSQ